MCKYNFIAIFLKVHDYTKSDIKVLPDSMEMLLSITYQLLLAPQKRDLESDARPLLRIRQQKYVHTLLYMQGVPTGRQRGAKTAQIFGTT